MKENKYISLEEAKKIFETYESKFKYVANNYKPDDEEFKKAQKEYLDAEVLLNEVKKYTDEKNNYTTNAEVNSIIQRLINKESKPEKGQNSTPENNPKENYNNKPENKPEDNQNSTLPPDDYPASKKGVMETIVDMIREIFGLKSSGVSKTNNNNVGLVTKIAQIFGFKPDSNEFKLLKLSIGICLVSIIFYILKPIFDVVVGTVKMIAGGLLNSISLGVGFMEVFGPYIIGAVFFVLFVMGAIKVYQYANIFMELLDDKLNKKIDEIKYGSRRRGKSSNTKNRDTKSNNEKSSNMTKQASSTPRRMIYDDEDIYISTESNKKEVEEIIEISKDNMQEEIIEISEENIQEEIIKEDMIEISESDIQKEVIEENVTKVSEDDIQEETTEESIIEISEDDTHEEVIKETN